jgi:hypothetical protein
MILRGMTLGENDNSGNDPRENDNQQNYTERNDTTEWQRNNTKNIGTCVTVN